MHILLKKSYTLHKWVSHNTVVALERILHRCPIAKNPRYLYIIYVAIVKQLNSLRIICKKAEPLAIGF